MIYFHNLLLLILCYLSEINSARILGIIPTPSISHQIVYRPIWKELSQRGHKVTVLTTDPINDTSLKNLTEIDLSFSYDLYNNKHNFSDKIDKLAGKPLEMVNAIITMNADICDEQLKHPKVKRLINDPNEHFDVILVEILQPCMFAFAHRFKAASIGVVSMDAQSAAYDSVVNPTHPILNPDFMLPLAGKLSFFERVFSVVISNVMRVYGFLFIIPINDKVIRENFGDDYPSCKDFIQYLDMLFVNVHPILSGIRPNVPAVVNIGAGLHIQSPKSLPEVSNFFMYRYHKKCETYTMCVRVKWLLINMSVQQNSTVR
nr:putative UDP-glucuronosyltransferase ugt-48 [Onthophagus taurus]